MVSYFFTYVCSSHGMVFRALRQEIHLVCHDTAALRQCPCFRPQPLAQIRMNTASSRSTVQFHTLLGNWFPMLEAVNTILKCCVADTFGVLHYLVVMFLTIDFHNNEYLMFIIVLHKPRSRYTRLWQSLPCLYLPMLSNHSSRCSNRISHRPYRHL